MEFWEIAFIFLIVQGTGTEAFENCTASCQSENETGNRIGCFLAGVVMGVVILGCAILGRNGFVYHGEADKKISIFRIPDSVSGDEGAGSSRIPPAVQWSRRSSQRGPLLKAGSYGFTVSSCKSTSNSSLISVSSEDVVHVFPGQRNFGDNLSNDDYSYPVTPVSLSSASSGDTCDGQQGEEQQVRRPELLDWEGEDKWKLLVPRESAYESLTRFSVANNGQASRLPRNSPYEEIQPPFKSYYNQSKGKLELGNSSGQSSLKGEHAHSDPSASGQNSYRQNLVFPEYLYANYKIREERNRRRQRADGNLTNEGQNTSDLFQFPSNSQELCQPTLKQDQIQTPHSAGAVPASLKFPEKTTPRKIPGKSAYLSAEKTGGYATLDNATNCGFEPPVSPASNSSISLYGSFKRAWDLVVYSTFKNHQPSDG